MKNNRYEGENARDIFEDGLAMQDACNLSGLAHSLAEMCSFLMANGADTDSVRKNPAVILAVDKMFDLVGRPSFDKYSEAYQLCKTRAGGGRS